MRPINLILVLLLTGCTPYQVCKDPNSHMVLMASQCHASYNRAAHNEHVKAWLKERGYINGE